MDVGGFRDGRRIAQRIRRGMGNCLHRHALGAGQRIDGGDAAFPCPEILGRERETQRFLDILIHILRGRPDLAGSEQESAFLCHEPIQRLRQKLVAHGDTAGRTALALIGTDDLAAFDLDMRLSQADRAIGLAARPADAQRAPVQQADNGGEAKLARAIRIGEIMAHTAAQFRQGMAEGDEIIELGRIARRRPGRVVAVLKAARLVASGGLDVATRIGADPDVLPGGRQNERAAPLGPLALQGLALAILVGEAWAAPPPRPAGLRRV